MPIITVCSSAHFYAQAVALRQGIEAVGYSVVLPKTADIMNETGDFDVSHYKTWYGDAKDYPKKAELMRAHFERIAEGDSILVLNFEKNGVANYIGPNVLIEMGVAFYLNKSIFIFNGLPTNSPFEEELRGFMPTFLHGSLNNLTKLSDS